MDALRFVNTLLENYEPSPKLLARDQLIKTGPFDQAEWNYRPVVGFVQRSRFRLALDLLGSRPYGSLLEIGYGSGVFMPELSRLSSRLVGLDVHDSSDAVAERLRQAGITAKLVKGSSECIPFPESSFDAVVSVSAIEFAPDLAAAASEVSRVLKPGGVAVIVLPGSSALLDLGLKLLTGGKAADSYRNENGTDRRVLVLRELLDRFPVERQVLWPGGLLPTIYTGLRLVKP
jgi:SAM-dependent methyltransferase